MHSISETNFKNILRTFSGCFLTKHLVRDRSLFNGGGGGGGGGGRATKLEKILAQKLWPSPC